MMGDHRLLFKELLPCLTLSLLVEAQLELP